MSALDGENIDVFKNSSFTCADRCHPNYRPSSCNSSFRQLVPALVFFINLNFIMKFLTLPPHFVQWWGIETIFYVVTLRRGRTCPREQLLQNYKAQRHAVFFLKDTLSIEDEKKCSRHANLSVCLFARDITRGVPPPKL